MSDHDYALAHQSNSGSGIADDPSDSQCQTCGYERDAYGFCPCGPIAVVCAWCHEAVIRSGYGLVEWEGGDESKVSHGLCAECAEGLS